MSYSPEMGTDLKVGKKVFRLKPNVSSIQIDLFHVLLFIVNMRNATNDSPATSV